MNFIFIFFKRPLEIDKFDACRVPGIGPCRKEGWNHPPGQEISKDVAILHKKFLSEIPLIFLPLESHPLI